MKTLDYITNVAPQELDRRLTQIAEIMDFFDFDKVHKAMVALNWKWAMAEDGVPQIWELRKEARRLLYQVAFSNCEMVSCGGFTASKMEDGLKLSFYVSEWETTED